MNKIGLIIAREYITRVRKKSFILMTFLGPVLFAALMILPGMLTTMEDTDKSTIAVVEQDSYGRPLPDSLQFFRDVIPDKENMKFVYLNNMRLQDVLKTYDADAYDGILFLSQDIISAGRETSVDFYYRKPPSLGMELHISKSLEKHIFDNKLIVNKIPVNAIQSFETKVNLKRIDWKNWQKGGEDATDIKRFLGYICGFLIYLFIFMFGAQVMRGVLEEKTSRIIEVIISSVKPFQLMLGKIIGIGLTGLTQFLAWIILTFAIAGITQQVFMPGSIKAVTEQAAPGNVMDAGTHTVQSFDSPQTESAIRDVFRQLRQVNFALVIGAFIFFFIGGYILYGSLFAAIGAASDNETDTQQFMFPISIPLIVGLLVMINTFLNPSGKLAVWFSIIPFTSPIVMMARIPFGVPPVGQILASVLLLILTFLFTTWLAAKIYRTGILMYGKKTSYREMWKWIRYKN
ncbi:MAG: family transporter protein [Bacteroidetes bacterium]|jgi:ABC-2 type transport system permease protein|nr:family transporter protein [Bacteroidota bacterium]